MWKVIIKKGRLNSTPGGDVGLRSGGDLGVSWMLVAAAAFEPSSSRVIAAL